MIDFIKSYVKYIEKKHGIKIDFHMTQPDIKFKEMFEQIGYPVASKEVAEYVRSIREKMLKLGITFDDIKEHLTSTIENAEYLRELGFSDYQVKRVCHIDKNNKEVNTFVIPYRWQPLLKAPFKVSGLCCSYLKKKPQKELSEKLGGLSPVLGEMAEESVSRFKAYSQTGCVFKSGKAYKAKPIGFWLEQDVLHYINDNDIPLFKLYGKVTEKDGEYSLTGIDRTGCKFCLFGCQMKNNKIHQLKDFEPHTCEVLLRPIKEGGLGFGEVLNYIDKECGVKVDLGQNNEMITKK